MCKFNTRPISVSVSRPAHLHMNSLLNSFTEDACANRFSDISYRDGRTCCRHMICRLGFIGEEGEPMQVSFHHKCLISNFVSLP